MFRSSVKELQLLAIKFQKTNLVGEVSHGVNFPEDAAVYV